MYIFGATAQPPTLTKKVKYMYRLLIMWVNKLASLRPICLREAICLFFINRHIKRSVLYLLHWSKRLCGCSEIKLVSLRLSTGSARRYWISEGDTRRGIPPALPPGRPSPFLKFAAELVGLDELGASFTTGEERREGTRA